MIRNKIFILFLFLGFGCTKNNLSDEVLQLDSYIFFDESTVKTKGNLHEGEALPLTKNTSFGVMGLKGASNEQVFGMYSNNVANIYRPDDEADFTYDKLVLWTNEPHKFCAYYPYDASCITGVVGGADPYLNYSQPTTLAGMTDVLTAYKEASYNANASANDNLVGLNFNHRFFAFNVQIANLYEGKKMTITKATLTATVPNGAKLYFNGNTLPNTTTTTIVHNYVTSNLELNSGAGINLNNQSNNNEVCFLFLPCASLDLDFKLSFINNWGQEVTFYVNGVTPSDPEGFVAGKKYSLVLYRKVVGDMVTFKPAIESWIIGSDINHDFE